MNDEADWNEGENCEWSRFGCDRPSERLNSRDLWNPRSGPKNGMIRKQLAIFFKWPRCAQKNLLPYFEKKIKMGKVFQVFVLTLGQIDRLGFI